MVCSETIDTIVTIETLLTLSVSTSILDGTGHTMPIRSRANGCHQAARNLL